MEDWYEPRVKESNGNLRLIVQKDVEDRNNLINRNQLVNDGNWSQVGPLSTPTSTGIGRVNIISLVTTNSNILYACTPASQLFK